MIVPKKRAENDRWTPGPDDWQGTMPGEQAPTLAPAPSRPALTPGPDELAALRSLVDGLIEESRTADRRFLTLFGLTMKPLQPNDPEDARALEVGLTHRGIGPADFVTVEEYDDDWEDAGKKGCRHNVKRLARDDDGLEGAVRADPALPNMVCVLCGELVNLGDDGQGAEEKARRKRKRRRSKPDDDEE